MCRKKIVASQLHTQHLHDSWNEHSADQEESGNKAIHQERSQQVWVSSHREVFYCLLCTYTVEPSALPSSKQAHQRHRDKQECCLRCIFKGKQLGVSKRDAHLWGVCSAFSPQGLQVSILMSQSMQSHAPVWSAWWIVPEFAPTGRTNNSGFTFTEVSVTTVSTKQMSLTLEPGKPPLDSLITSKKLTGEMLVSSVSPLPSVTVCKVNQTA